MLFDYLTDHDKEVTDPEMESEINALRERIPAHRLRKPSMVSSSFQKGKEAIVFHDEDAKDCLQALQDEGGEDGGLRPRTMRLDEDDSIRVEMGPKPSFEQFLNRVENVNNHGKIDPDGVRWGDAGRLCGLLPAFRGWAKGARRARSRKLSKRLDMKMLTDIGGIAAIGKVGDKYVLFDDLHQDNVQESPEASARRLSMRSTAI